MNSEHSSSQAGKRNDASACGQSTGLTPTPEESSGVVGAASADGTCAADVSGASGKPEATEGSDASGLSGVSGASDASGASGVSNTRETSDTVHIAPGFERLTLGDVLKEDTGTAPGAVYTATGMSGGQNADGQNAGRMTGGQRVGGFGSSTSNAYAPSGCAPGGLPPTPGGAWVWNPDGYEPKKSWRKRHPLLFWGGLLLLLLLVFSWGKMSSLGESLGGPRIAVVKIEGVILDSGPIIEFIDQVREDSSIKGAIIRIDSPGGGVGASQELYTAVKRLSASKPTVASMGSMAASGGYYAAIGAHHIIAGPSTVTGSIGVKMQIPNLEGLMQTVGVSETTLTTGRLKDAGSSWRAMTGEEAEYFKGLLNDMYEEFLASIALERPIKMEELKELADGRALTGRQALDAKLVDSLGDLHSAISRVKGQALIPEDTSVRLIYGPEKPSEFLDTIVRSAMNSLQEQKMNASQPCFLF